MDRDYNISGYTSYYSAAHMINLEWVQHRSGVHQMFPSKTDSEDVTSYAVHRPDGNWSVMLMNRDESNAHTVRVVFDDQKGKLLIKAGARASLADLMSMDYLVKGVIGSPKG